MFDIDKKTTFFDIPLRSTPSEIERGELFLNSNPTLKSLLEAFPSAVLLLDARRHIVAYNEVAKRTLNADGNDRIEGRRVGEAINCIHAFDMPAGCGTSEFCKECGAGKCNKYTRETLKSCTSECRITTRKDNIEKSLDLRIHTSIIQIEGNNFTFFAIEDIQDEKRRKVLERIFFHDVLNTATSVLGLSEIINNSDSLEMINEFKAMLYSSSKQLVKEIQSQRDLINAEQGTLSVNNELNSVNEILSSAFNIYKDSKLSAGKKYTCYFEKNDCVITTDSVLLIRSIGNLIKNALEATDNNGYVKIYSTRKKERILFNIENDAIIPSSIQLQIFQRSFSTKAPSGRGIGTYSVKLIVEQYLNGRVSFESNTSIGTVFTIELPL
jgi:K+-sensing histidine kinase KdpD